MFKTWIMFLMEKMEYRETEVSGFKRIFASLLQDKLDN